MREFWVFCLAGGLDRPPLTSTWKMIHRWVPLYFRIASRSRAAWGFLEKTVENKGSNFIKNP